MFTEERKRNSRKLMPWICRKEDKTYTKGFMPRVTERRKRNKKKLGYTVDKRTTKSMDGLLTFNRQTEARATTLLSQQLNTSHGGRSVD